LEADDKQFVIFYPGTVFDVTRKAASYGKGGSYNILAGRDGSRALGLSSLKLEDAIADYSTLDEKELATLNQWYGFFQ
jgi:membrane-associated progesterone receptor component